jgi:hypothetical protein
MILKPIGPHKRYVVFTEVCVSAEPALGDADKWELNESKDRKSGNARKSLRRRG